MEMISFLGKSITLFLLRNNIIEKEKTPVYEYGFEVMISTMIDFCLIFTAVFLLNELASAMIFYSMFIIVRQYTGGICEKTDYTIFEYFCDCFNIVQLR